MLITEGELKELEKIEIDLLLEGIFRYYGFDFRNYVFSSIRRRIWHRIYLERASSVSGLQELVLHNPQIMKSLLEDFSITVTEMFRDPSFFNSFRTKIIPMLREYPVIRIWHAGCSTGEEVYSMAILLYEEGLYEKATLYATDINETAIETAKSGLFPLKKMQLYTKNYLHSGGKKAFSEYYSVKDGKACFHSFLRENIVFAQHNLAVDHSFNEFHVILCRNVMIYFDTTLQNRVHDLFYNSLVSSGILGIGKKEDLAFTSHSAYYEELDSDEKLFRKIK
ncbi:chemotaxis protein CheR [Bacillus sp. SA1-12]|uniref:CheR family methyltransferase n=1 Tax=Bacillus sp. SA1-12 TaxID=1455638 RepID=UPI000626441C|nr:protein-glutamate O-methyltransferase CheR [Bacillus sp. SA1-12]KKI92020.1 chemotaxis protein CheR [Bacillus sp. SA1-12]